jgi:hypothetical protein
LTTRLRSNIAFSPAGQEDQSGALREACAISQILDFIETELLDGF